MLQVVRNTNAEANATAFNTPPDVSLHSEWELLAPMQTTLNSAIPKA